MLVVKGEERETLVFQLICSLRIRRVHAKQRAGRQHGAREPPSSALDGDLQGRTKKVCRLRLEMFILRRGLIKFWSNLLRRD